MARTASVSTARLHPGCAAVLALALLASACGGGSTTPTAPSPTPQVQPGTANPGPAGTFGTSLAVSPSVVATVSTVGDRLSLLVLWRGAARWYLSSLGVWGGKYSGGQAGLLSVTLQYGQISVDLTLDPAQHTAVVQGRQVTLPPDANVLLVDRVDAPDRGGLVDALSVDPANVNIRLESGSRADGLFRNVAQLIARSPAVVAFLECGAAPADPMTIGVCSFLPAR